MRRGTLTLCAALLVIAPATPATAADIPAYGVITIADHGLGAVPTWTYDPALWTCSTTIDGAYLAPSAITVTCDSNLEVSPFGCPLMVLTVETYLPTSHAGGRASCTRTLDTGMVSGTNTARVTGNLGRANVIVCRAYGRGYPLLPPYSVTCAEPGLPAPALTRR